MNHRLLYYRTASDPQTPPPQLMLALTQQMPESGLGFAQSRTVQDLLNRRMAEVDLTFIKTVTSDAANEILISTDGLGELSDDGTGVTDQNGAVREIGGVVGVACLLQPNSTGGYCSASIQFNRTARAVAVSNGTNPVDGVTITIAGKTYTFKTTLGSTEGNVLIGVNATATMANLVAAINRSGTPGTVYIAAAAHAAVSAVASGLTANLYARTAGAFTQSVTVNATYFAAQASGGAFLGGLTDVLNLPASAEAQRGVVDFGDVITLDPDHDALNCSLQCEDAGGDPCSMTLILLLQKA